MINKGKVGIFKPKTYLSKSAKSTSEQNYIKTPTSISEALHDNDWKFAMIEEYNALIHNRTRTLVLFHRSQKVLGSKWVFKVKYNPDGSVSRFKARLVAKGYHQTPGIDYTETFSLVVKAQTTRTMMSIIVSNNWEIQQVDVNNAFLNRDLGEDVYLT